jgi:hypothetical protein
MAQLDMENGQVGQETCLCVCQAHVMNYTLRMNSDDPSRWLPNSTEITTPFLIRNLQHFYEMPSSVSTASATAAVSGYGLALRIIPSQIMTNYDQLHQPSFDQQTNYISAVRTESILLQNYRGFVCNYSRQMGLRCKENKTLHDQEHYSNLHNKVIRNQNLKLISS